MKPEKEALTIVMQNRSRKGWPGGDMVAMDGMAKALTKAGIRVSEAVPKRGQKIIISWNINYPWVLNHLVQARLCRDHLLVFALNMNVNDKGFQRLIAEYSDGIIFVSDREQQSFEKYIGQKVRIPTYVCGIGVEAEFISPRLTGKNGVLTVGRIETRKNQLRLIKTCIKLGVPLNIVGKISDQEYYRECVKAAEGYPQCRFWGEVSQAKLKELYTQAKVVAHPAVFEPWGLTIREGALANCNLLMTRNTYLEDEIPQLWWCNPEDQEDISRKLMEAYQAPINRQNQAYVMDKYSWKKIAQSMKGILEKSLSRQSNKGEEKFWRGAASFYANNAMGLEEKGLEQQRLIEALDLANREKQTAIESLQKANLEKQRALEAGFTGKAKYYFTKIWQRH